MRLKRLKLSGFKSFCEDTELLFRDNGITVVVGPNGCGKSNVVDAIRWVLGEQSPKFLRGHAMGDVIFNGSEVRKPVGRSEVTIHFDNSAGLAPEKYRDLTEISVTRRLYRSGESDYLINKKPCRLMDVRELVMDTGAAGRSYSIVEQGKVEEFITASPAERRLYMEEAAGIVRYKTKRAAAEKKLEQTRTNLDRVEDVMGELTRQEDQLREQKERAGEYISLRNRVESLSLDLARVKYFRSARHCQEKEKARDALAIEAHTLQQKLSTNQARLSSLNLEQTSREAKLKEQREALHEKERAIHTAETTLALERQKRDNNQAWIGQTGQSLSDMERRRQELAEQIETAQKELTGLAAGGQELSAKIASEEAALAELEADRVAKENEVRSFQERLLEIHTRLTGFTNQRQFLTERMSEGARQRETLVAQIAEAKREQEAMHQGLSDVRMRTIAQRKVSEEAEAKIAGLAGEIGQATQGVEEARLRMQGAEREVMECTSRLESLREIAANREEFDEKVREVLAWAEANPEAREAFGWLGPLADHLQAPPELAEQLGGYLEAYLELIVLRESAQMGPLQEALEAQGLGGAKFVALDSVAGASLPSAGANALSEKIHLPPEWQELEHALFGGVHVYPSATVPAPLPGNAGNGTEWISQEGGFHIDGKRVVTLGHTPAPAAGMLRRKAEIETLTEKSTQLLAAREASSQALQQAENTLTTIQRQQKENEEIRTEVTLALSQLEQELLHGEREVQRLTQAHATLEGNLTQLTEDTQRFSTEISTQEAQNSQAQADKIQLEEEMAKAQQQATLAAELVAQASRTLTDQKIAFQKESSQAEHADSRLKNLKAEAEQLESRAQADKQNLTQKQTEHAEAETTITRISGELETQREQYRTAEMVLKENTLLYDQQETERRGLIRQVGEARTASERAQQRLHEVDLALTAERTRMEQFAEKLGETPELELFQEEVDEAAMEKELISSQRKLGSMDAVNLAAPEEYDALVARLQFLRIQQDDLVRATEDLEESIRRMNQESRKRFKEAFEKVNEKFQEVFPLVFNGGAAKLILTDSEDMLLAGVDIQAQPPGKKLQSLNLLSGGEKALTAIALIFSFFLIKPSPFCLLDEVDAPLDDINVGRFAKLIQSMTEHSQFIIITHNKRTMEIGDTLYGVTMEEAGVSKVVSVDLSDKPTAA